MSRLRDTANVLAAQLDLAILTAAAFFVTPAILSSLGAANYGGWLLINSFVSYLKLLDLGTSQGTVKYGAGALGRKNDEDLSRVLNTSMAIFLTLGLLGLGLTFVFMGVMPRVFPDIASGQTRTILLLGIATSIELGCRPFGAALRMKSYHFVYDIAEICTCGVFKVGLVLYLAHQRRLSYETLAFLTFCESTVRMTVTIIASFILNSAVRRINPFRASKEIARKLASMSAAMTVIMVADILRFQIDAAVIGYFMPHSPQSISIFGVGTRLPSMAYSLIGVVSGVLTPRFSAMSETGDDKGLKQLFKTTSLVSGLVSSLTLVGIGVLGPNFLWLWLKQPWLGTSGNVLLIMLPAYYIALMSSPAAQVVMGNGRLRGLSILTALEAVANLVLSAILIHPFGVYGVALGTAIPMIVFRGLVFPSYMRKDTEISPKEYWSAQWPAVRVGLVFLALSGGISQIPIRSYGQFFSLGAATTVLFVLVVLAMNRQMREAFFRRLRRRQAPRPDPG